MEYQMPNGRLVKLEALKSDADDGYFVHCDADMRWVVHSTDAAQNLSESLVQGFNGGSLDFVLDGHIHSMGGYGLWRRHFDLIRFHGGPQAWQLVAPTATCLRSVMSIKPRPFFGRKGVCFCGQRCSSWGVRCLQLHSV